MDFKPIELSGKCQYVLVGLARGFTIPNGAANNQAVEVLRGNGLIDAQNKLTDYGRDQLKRYMGAR